MLDDVRGAREGGIGRGLVADQFDEADIVGAIVPDARRARLRRLGGGGDRRQRLVVDLRSVRRRPSPAPRSRRPRRRRSRRPSARGLRPGSDSAACTCGEPSRRLRPPGTGRSPKPAAFQSAAVSTASTPGAALAARGVDRLDLGVRMRRAQHHAVGHAGQLDVVDIAAAALDQPRILEARHALTDCEFTHATTSYLSMFSECSRVGDREGRAEWVDSSSCFEFFRHARREISEHAVGAGALEGDQAFHTSRARRRASRCCAAAMIIAYSPDT